MNDVMAGALGALGALGACAALYARNRLERGQQVTVTLCAASCLVQSEDLVRFEGRPRRSVGGRDFVGPGPLTRLYRCADGWVRLDGRPGDRASVAGAGFVSSELGASGASADDWLADAIVAALSDLPIAEVLRRCHAVDLSAVEARKSRQLVGDELLISHGLLEALGRDEKGVGRVSPGHWVGLPGVDRRPPGLSPLLGEHGEAVLLEAGIALAQVQELVDAQVAAGGRPLP